MPRSAEKQAMIDREFERFSSELDSAEAQRRFDGPIRQALHVADRKHQQFLVRSWETAKDQVVF